MGLVLAFAGAWTVRGSTVVLPDTHGLRGRRAQKSEFVVDDDVQPA